MLVVVRMMIMMIPKRRTHELKPTFWWNILLREINSFLNRLYHEYKHTHMGWGWGIIIPNMLWKPNKAATHTLLNQTIHPSSFIWLPSWSLSLSLYTQLSFFLCVLILHFLWSFFLSNVACNLFCKTRPLVQLWWKGWGLLFITSAAFNQKKWRRSNRIFSTFFRQKKSSNIFFLWAV